MKKIWRLIYPDKTENLFNYDPIKYEQDNLEKLQKAYNIAMKEITRLRNLIYGESK